MPLQAKWQLACVKFLKQDSVGIENAAWRLVACLGGSWVTIYRGVVVVLFSGAGQTAQSTIETEMRRALADEGPVRVGLSATFGSILSLRDAFRQAETAVLYGGLERISLGNVNAALQVTSSEIAFYSWREGFVNYLLYAHGKDRSFIELCLHVHPFGRMCLDDLECATSQMSVVLTYLAYNCKATPTAEALHMHRNNVLYHLGQIKQRYGIDLDDAEMRFEVALLARFMDVSNRQLRCAVPQLEGEELASEH